jgi:tetratricopeptide (TPR) repeat protein
MRAFVFTDPALASHAGRFVWLDIDIDRPQNAAFLEKFPIDALPTFLVIDPADEVVARRWVGSLTVAQLQGFLDEASATTGKPRVRVIWGTLVDPGMSPHRHSTATEALDHADSLCADGGSAEAAVDYQVALALAPADWPHYGRAVTSLLGVLEDIQAHELTVTIAREALLRLGQAPYSLAVAVAGLDAALALSVDRSDRQRVVSHFESTVRRRLEKPPPDVSADDISSAYGSLVEARKQAKDPEGARGTAEQWASYLEAEAARAKTPDQRAVFDSHRLSAYLELGRPERAIPMLEASERDRPDDYNPPARLAVAYERLKRWDEALAASDRALAKVYGPRRLRVLLVRADIHAGRGDKAAAKGALAEAVAFAEGLPAGQRSEKTIESLRARLRALE